DSYGQYCSTSGHSLYWFGSPNESYLMDDNGGLLVIDEDGNGLGDGTGRLTGTVWLDGVVDGAGWDIDFSYQGGTYTAPVGSPKRELKDEAYSDNGGPVDDSTWYYFTQLDGMLTGRGSNAGTTVYTNRMGPSFQAGFGANGKNIQWGASGWFYIYDDAGYSNEIGRGDINVIPEPTSLILLSLGLLGFSVTRRMRKQ
ncbi:MAG: PEP-CTERM sorting domain-containing protein, partial [Pseudomonadota bacterium]